MYKNSKFGRFAIETEMIRTEPYAKALVLVIILAWMLICPEMTAQEARLNMTVDECIQSFGEPDNKMFWDAEDGRTGYMFYGNDYFSFVDNRLHSINVMSDHFSLVADPPYVITVGDSFLPFRLTADSMFELISSDGNSEVYKYKGSEGSNAGKYISVLDDVVISYTVTGNMDDSFRKREFLAFLESAYNPVAEIPENSLWPARMGLLWNQSSQRLSRDKTKAICCIPFVGEYNAKARYSGEDSPEVGRRLVVTKFLDGSELFKQSIVSVVPKAGLSPGDEFSGLIVYNNVNTASSFAWDIYENGLLVYSKFPSNISEDDFSQTNADLRLNRKLYYAGGPDAITEYDWLIVSANRMDVTKAFPGSFAPGRTEEKIKAEKAKYSFSSEINPEYLMMLESREQNMGMVGDELQDGNQAEDDIALQENEQTEPGGDSPMESMEEHIAEELEETPSYVGDVNNLRRIVNLKNSPVELEHVTRQSQLRNQESRQVLACTNTDFCDYTIRIVNGLTHRVAPGRTEITSTDVRGSFRYYWFRGKVLSDVDVKFPYALPVASGTRIQLIDDPREEYRSYAVIMKTGDTVRSMRGGRVCKTDDRNSVLICHKDGTFAAYMNVDDVCVFPGDRVNTGDSIGVCGGGKLSISIFYLDPNKISSKTGSAYTHITPYIRTENGDVKLIPGIGYVSLTDSDIITKEMGALEKRQYLKKESK